MKELYEESIKWLKDNKVPSESQRFVSEKGSKISDENYVEILIPNLLASLEDRINKLPNVQVDGGGNFQDALKG